LPSVSGPYSYFTSVFIFEVIILFKQGPKITGKNIYHIYINLHDYSPLFLLRKSLTLFSRRRRRRRRGRRGGGGGGGGGGGRRRRRRKKRRRRRRRRKRRRGDLLFY
jgi:hypothetical protein